MTEMKIKIRGTERTPLRNRYGFYDVMMDKADIEWVNDFSNFSKQFELLKKKIEIVVDDEIIFGFGGKDINLKKYLIEFIDAAQRGELK
jgi:hypothetical protein